MDARTQVREFLVARRERISPQEVGIAVGPGRKVRGLRRSEVAALAGVSVEHYTRIERGAIARVSPQVLDAIARALRLGEAERAHLSNLAEIVAHAGGTDRRTSTRRTEAARDPHSADLHETVEEPLSHSAEFETRWRAGEVHRHGTGTKTFRHPVVGELAVAYEALALESAPGLTLTLYTAEPGTVSARRMARLAELTGVGRPTTSGVTETPSTAMRSVAVSPDGRGP
ncbi:helix-turn-helix transcriptional regulator [Cellulosimicrobium sp. NPDC055967]|uniref:helix-turn-helix transcriptional regulator n=1 Tax=Cellulosimicrobium sp. NPDC055967 TaxID=3345670 RepID=UPI0035DB9603